MPSKGTLEFLQTVIIRKRGWYVCTCVPCTYITRLKA